MAARMGMQFNIDTFNQLIQYNMDNNRHKQQQKQQQQHYLQHTTYKKHPMSGSKHKYKNVRSTMTTEMNKQRSRLDGDNGKCNSIDAWDKTGNIYNNKNNNNNNNNGNINMNMNIQKLRNKLTNLAINDNRVATSNSNINSNSNSGAVLKMAQQQQSKIGYNLYYTPYTQLQHGNAPIQSNIRDTGKNGRRYSENSQSRGKDDGLYLQNRRSLQLRTGSKIAAKIRMNSEYSINTNNHYRSIQGQKQAVNMSQPINPNQFIQQLQKQKNKRIQQIYNPQSVGNLHQYAAANTNKYQEGTPNGNKIVNNGSSTALEAKHKNANHQNSIALLRTINKMKIKAKINQHNPIQDQSSAVNLVKVLRKDKNNQLNASHNRDRSLDRSRKSKDSQAISKQSKKERRRLLNPGMQNKVIRKTNSNSIFITQNSIRAIDDKSAPKILPVTFQRIQQLSTITQSVQNRTKKYPKQRQQKSRRYKSIESSQAQAHEPHSQSQNSNKRSIVKNINKIKMARDGNRDSGTQHREKLKNIQLLQDKQQSQIDRDCQDTSIHSKTPISDTVSNTMPFPKFNNFFDNYSNQDRDKKTYLFNKIKNVGNPISKINDIGISQSQVVQKISQISIGSQTGQKKYAQLKIFSELDKSCLRAIKLQDGSGTFYGQVQNQNEGKLRKNGKGAIFYNSGKIYQGQFVNDEKNGQGVETYIDGSIYRGQFANGKRNGKGRFQWPNGEIYDGQWKDNMKHGSGLWENGCRQNENETSRAGNSIASYIGEWSFNQISGFGVLTNQKGQRYEGQFQHFQKQGHGAFRFENGDRLVGNFKRNQPNGQCQYFWLNGDYYKGNFSNGLRHGKGIVKYSDGSYFQGEFRNDKKCGLGQERYIDGVIYYGNYQNDFRHGFGKLIYQEVVYYQGYWINNVAVIFHEDTPNFTNLQNPIQQDEKQRLPSGMSNNFSSNNLKLKKLPQKDQQKIIASMRNRGLKKQKIQKFSSKNLLERLTEPKKRCKCLSKH